MEQLYLPHHVKIMKVALAVAIIRQKPSGVSSREFTERLALQFTQLQTNWKERARELEQELLRTRQELVKYQIHLDNLSQTLPVPLFLPPPNGPSQDANDSEWQSSGYCSSFLSQSQGQRTVAHLLTLQKTQPPPILGAHTNRVSATKETRGLGAEGKDTGVVTAAEESLPDGIRAHVKFLQSVSSLMATQHHLSALTSSDLRVTVRDSVLNAITGLSEALGSAHLPHLPLSGDTLEVAVNTIVDVIQVPSMVPFLVELVQACTELLSAIIRRLACQQGVHKHNQKCLQSLTVSLSGIPELFQHAVDSLTQHVVTCAETLGKSLEDVSFLDPDGLENTAAVLQTLEELLTKYNVSILSQDTCSRLTEGLESSLLELADSFPLFTFSVWKLTAYLSPHAT